MKPRLSIIVPYCRDEAAFETTLVSVLENRPNQCEVLVPHDGSYQDPFDLSDEVKFVVTDEEPSLVGLLDAAVQRAKAPLVHVLAEGLRATEGWTDSACDLFGVRNTGAVAPVVLDLGEREQIVAAGWTTDRKTIYRPITSRSRKLSPQSIQQLVGPYLCASFWRRDCLSACLEAGIGHGVEAAQLAIGYALQACGIECRTAETSYLLGEPVAFAAPTNSAIALEAQTVRMGAMHQGRAKSVFDSLLGWMTCATSITGWKRTAGRMVASLTRRHDAQVVAQQIQAAQQMWAELDGPRHAILTMNQFSQPARRAA